MMLLRATYIFPKLPSNTLSSPFLTFGWLSYHPCCLAPFRKVRLILLLLNCGVNINAVESDKKNLAHGTL